MNQLSKEPMNFRDYQVKATGTVEYPEAGRNIVYPALGLAGEAGEVAEKIKKFWRKTRQLSPKGPVHYWKEQDLNAKELLLELGDCLWYIAAICTELDYDLDDVAVLNLAKLADRKERNVIKGEGDNR